MQLNGEFAVKKNILQNAMFIETYNNLFLVISSKLKAAKSICELKVQYENMQVPSNNT